MMQMKDAKSRGKDTCIAMPECHAVPDALGRDLEECTEAVRKPGKGKDGDDAHAQHEFEGMKIHGRHGSAARCASPTICSRSCQLRTQGFGCQERGNLPLKGVYGWGVYMPKVN